MATIAILLFDGVDIIDSGGPYEVFLTASRLQTRRGEPAGFDVVLVSPDGQDVTAYGGMTITALRSPRDVGPVDVAVVPGTIDVEKALANTQLMDSVGQLANAASLVTSVCTGAFLLADAGLLRGLPATTHWEDVGDLAALDEVGSGETGRRWVDAGNVVTSAGLTSGIHMALHVVERLASRGLAVATARQLDMPFDPEGVYTA